MLFGLGHLPGIAAMDELVSLIFGTIIPNALGGLLFYWLYWRHNLEGAMAAHAATHFDLFIVNLELVLFV